MSILVKITIAVCGAIVVGAALRARRLGLAVGALSALLIVLSADWLPRWSIWPLYVITMAVCIAITVRAALRVRASRVFRFGVALCALSALPVVLGAHWLPDWFIPAYVIVLMCTAGLLWLLDRGTSDPG